MNYTPFPFNTSSISLSEDILDLTEFLAKNIHENWAKQRLAEGWKFGMKSDDAKKEHPNLIPYEDLPESEKEYDRKTAIETLKTVIAVGYGIVK